MQLTAIITQLVARDPKGPTAGEVAVVLRPEGQPIIQGWASITVQATDIVGWNVGDPVVVTLDRPKA